VGRGMFFKSECDVCVKKSVFFSLVTLNVSLIK